MCFAFNHDKCVSFADSQEQSMLPSCDRQWLLVGAGDPLSCSDSDELGRTVLSTLGNVSAYFGHKTGVLDTCA